MTQEEKYKKVLLKIKKIIYSIEIQIFGDIEFGKALDEILDIVEESLKKSNKKISKKDKDNISLPKL